LFSAENIFCTLFILPPNLLPVVTVPLVCSGYASANPQLFVLMKVGSSTFSRDKMQEMTKEMGRQMLFRVKVHVQ
jgi:hypothetical protein